MRWERVRGRGSYGDKRIVCERKKCRERGRESRLKSKRTKEKKRRKVKVIMKRGR